MKLPRAETKLSQYYHEELGALRSEGRIFAAQNPETARALGMDDGHSPDPQVELLLQSFAFLGGRLRHQVEVDKARIPNALAESLYPHLGAPVPSMVVVQVSDALKKQQLARLQGVSVQARNDAGGEVDCRFRMCFDAPLLPLEVVAVALYPASRAPWLAGPGARARSVLSVRINKDPRASSVALGRERLRFFIDTSSQHAAFRLYEWLALQLCAIGVEVPGQDNATHDAGSLRWLGYGDEAAVLLNNGQTPPGYRLLQEYFAFPDKFLFFEVDGVELAALGDSFELLFALETPFDKAQAYPAHTLRLNCVPLVNLFSRPIEPVSLDHTEYEYRLVADHEQHRYHEIYALEQLYSLRPDGSMRTIRPYFGLDQLDSTRQPDYFYVGRRARSEATDVAGGEYFVSFLDQKFDMTILMDEVVGGRALCTNRRLPEQLRIGSELQLEGAGPAVTIRTVSIPTAHHMPAQIGQRPWSLVSQLALNRLSLADGEASLAALKEILQLHAGANRSAALRQIDGIERVACGSVMRHYRQAQWRGFVRAAHVHLSLDRHSFPNGSPVLFWNVLRHFFALYISVNNLVHSSFETNDCSGNDQSWPPMNGTQCVL